MSDGEEQANPTDGDQPSPSKLFVQTTVGQGGSIGYSTSLARDRDDLQQNKVSVFKKISPGPHTDRSSRGGPTNSHESSRHGSLQELQSEVLQQSPREQRKEPSSAGGESGGADQAKETLPAKVMELIEARQSLERPSSPGTEAAQSAPGSATRAKQLQQPTVPIPETTKLATAGQKAQSSRREKPKTRDQSPVGPTSDIEKKLDELRIVKSIHSKLKRKDAENQLPDESHSRDKDPQQPEFLSAQQQRGFVPDENLVLMGELKPKFFKTRATAQKRGRHKTERTSTSWRPRVANASSQVSQRGSSVLDRRSSLRKGFEENEEESDGGRTAQNESGLGPWNSQAGPELRFAGRAASLARVMDQIIFKDGISHHPSHAKKQCECGEGRGTQEGAAKLEQHFKSRTLYSFHKSLLAQNQNHRKFFFEPPSQSPSSSREAAAADHNPAFQKNLQLQPMGKRQRRGHRNDVAPATRSGTNHRYQRPRPGAGEVDGVLSVGTGEVNLPVTPSSSSNWRVVSRMHQSQNFTTPLRDMRPSEHLQPQKNEAELRSDINKEQKDGADLDGLDLPADQRKPSVTFLQNESAADERHEQKPATQRSRTPFNQASRSHRDSRLAHTASRFQSPSTSLAPAPAPKADDAKEKAIETRIMNQLRRELDEQEYEVYKQYGKLAQLFNDDTANRRFNLTSLPEWIELTKSLHKTTLSILKSFSSKILSQNYYEIGPQPNKVSGGLSASSPKSVDGTTSVFTAATSSKFRPAQQVVTPRGEFLDMFVARIQKSFAQNEQALADSHEQLSELRERVARLEKELAEYKGLDYRAKTKAEVIQQIVEDYFTRIDGDCATHRLRDADAFLDEKVLVPQEEIMRRDRIEHRMDQRRANSRGASAILEEVETQLTGQAVHEIHSGLREIKFDRDFVEKLRALFEDNFKYLQGNTALKVARLMYKEVTVATVEVQASEKEIDMHLMSQIAEAKLATREWMMKLQCQVNKTTVLENDLTRVARTLKDCNKEVANRDGQLLERDKEISMQRMEIYRYKAILDAREKEQKALSDALGKHMDQVDKYKDMEKQVRLLFEKAKEGNQEKTKMLKEQEGLIKELENLANEEQAERIRIVNLMYKRIETLDKELDESIKTYAKRSYKKRSESSNFQFTKVAEIPGEENGDDGEEAESPVKLGLWQRKPPQDAFVARAPSYSESGEAPSPSFSNATEAVDQSVKIGEETPAKGGSGMLSPSLGAALIRKVIDGSDCSKKKKDETQDKGSGSKKKKKKKKGAKNSLSSKVGNALLKKNKDLIQPDDEEDDMEEGSEEESNATEVASSGKGGKDVRVDTIKEQLDEDSNQSISLRQTPLDANESAEEFQGKQQERIKEIQLDELDTHRDMANSARESAIGYNTFGRSTDNGTLERLNSLGQSFNGKRILSNDKLASLPQTDLDSNAVTEREIVKEKEPQDGQGKRTKDAKAGDERKGGRFSSAGSVDAATIHIQTKERPALDETLPTLAKVNPFGFGAIKVDKEVQTDSEKFFSYVLDFLSLLESRLSTGEISINEVLDLGHMVLEERGISRWSYKTPEPKKKDTQAIIELQQCLAKLKSIRSYGGDVFFAGLGRVFAAQPVVPQAYDAVKSVPNKDLQTPSKRTRAVMKVQEVKDLEQLKQITKVRFSAGGGVGEASQSTPKPQQPTEANYSFSKTQQTWLKQ